MRTIEVVVWAILAGLCATLCQAAPPVPAGERGAGKPEVLPPPLAVTNGGKAPSTPPGTNATASPPAVDGGAGCGCSCGHRRPLWRALIEFFTYYRIYYCQPGGCACQYRGFVPPYLYMLHPCAEGPINYPCAASHWNSSCGGGCGR